MKSKIIETIEQYDTIIIARHVRPDPDAYGSQLGLKALIQHNYPHKNVYADGAHESSLSYLGTPEPIDPAQFKNALMIITDTANTERIDSEHYAKSAYILKIDHHPDVDPYGDVRWVDTSASSTSEMIVALFEHGVAQNGWEMTGTVAKLLFAGIVGDTGRFMYPSTTIQTFQRASQLLNYDFDRAELFDRMYEIDRKVLHLEGYIYQNFVMDEFGTAHMKITKDTLNTFQVTASEASQLVATLGNVKGIRAWAIMVEEDDQIRVRLRSKGPIINTLAAEYNGGGHPLASGATVYSWDEADALLEKLSEICQTK